MPRASSVCICLLLAASLVAGSALAAEPSPRTLVVLDDPAPGVVSRLLAADLMVVRDVERYLLIVVPEERLPELSAFGSWRVLDADIAGDSFYVVAGRDFARLAAVRSGADILRHDGLEAVVRATPDQAERFAEAGFEIARIFLRPVRPATGETPELRLGLRAADPAIEAMVAQVSGAGVDATVQRLQDFVTRYATHDSCQAAANWIKAQFESFGIDSVYFHSFSTTYKPNVVAVIPGKGDPSQLFVIGGHYDSITSNHDNCPGADDNASGSACVLECARILSQYDFNYTLVFITFCGEELGLYGSEGFAADAAAAGDDIVGMLNLDMIGYLASGDIMDLDVVDNASSQWMRDLAFQVAADYVPELPLVDGSLPAGASSDHASFWAHGFHAIMFFEDTGNYSPYIHTTNDIVGLSYNSPTLAERSVKVSLAMMATLAEPFSIAISHTPLPNTENTTDPYRVVANILAAEPVNPDSLLVEYATNWGSGTLTLTPTGNPDEYEAYIPAQPGGTTVDYYLVAEDVSGHRTVHPRNAPAETHTFFVGTITAVWEDNFETDRGWTVGDVGDDATTGIWERCDPEATVAQPEDDHTPAPGVNAYITQCAAGTSQGTYDVDGGKTTLLSPVLDFSGYPNAHVRYYRWYSNATGSEPGTDVWIVDVSDDGGGTWYRLEETTQAALEWLPIEVDLADIAGLTLTSQMMFRFIASDEGGGSIVEAGVDDFAVLVFQEPSTPVVETLPGAGERLLLAQNVPNPFHSATTIRFCVPAPGCRAVLSVYDVAGRRVAKLLDEKGVAGTRAVTWDGCNESGAAVAPGIYFYRLDADEESLARKLVLLR